MDLQSVNAKSRFVYCSAELDEISAIACNLSMTSSIILHVNVSSYDDLQSLVTLFAPVLNNHTYSISPVTFNLVCKDNISQVISDYLPFRISYKTDHNVTHVEMLLVKNLWNIH